MRRLFVGLLLAGCMEPRDRQELTPDASVSAEQCDDLDYQWSELDGMAPSGSLAAFHYAYAYYTFCGGYVVALRQQPRCAAPDGPILTLGFVAEHPAIVGEVLPAGVALLGVEGTLDATFTVHSYDFGVFDPRGQRHFAGRFETSAPGWNLSFNVDVVTQYGESCTLL